ncbi:hypothetical protein [Geothrix sp. PMB-07]|uniref:hypothetical protein n=1 Tax=Geothrix sp. PMB-07 TaxID=3068640 RepID=UPI00274188F9|nr:hypothetical protein [Geothrix sp. PMB-07]WLT32284.1 hypothetical protein Q9293_02915 [Geothrix sp. PMB-07]
MIQHPGILALLLASGIVSAFLLAASGLGLRILRHWDLRSGSEAQLELERRTYLVSTLVANALAIQVLSLFLFIYTVDGLHTQFVGAMCAAGSLSVNAYGYPALLAKVATCLVAGLWLILHRADTQGHDYPLIRPKYALLMLLLPLVLGEAWLQGRYLTGLHADVMTSCCGSLFGQGRPGLASDLASLSPQVVQPAFWTCFGALVISSVAFLKYRQGGRLLACLGLGFFPVAIAALIAFFGLYIYALPTHHCPFCLLHAEYGFVGYPLYAALLGSAISAFGLGALSFFQQRASLSQALPRLRARLAIVVMALALMFTLIVSLWMALSPLRL